MKRRLKRKAVKQDQLTAFTKNMGSATRKNAAKLQTFYRVLVRGAKQLDSAREKLPRGSYRQGQLEDVMDSIDVAGDAVIKAIERMFAAAGDLEDFR